MATVLVLADGSLVPVLRLPVQCLWQPQGCDQISHTPSRWVQQWIFVTRPKKEFWAGVMKHLVVIRWLGHWDAVLGQLSYHCYSCTMATFRVMFVHSQLFSLLRCTHNDTPIIMCAERCLCVIAKPPSESAVQAWFYNLTNSLQQTMNDEGTFLALFPSRILTSLSNCRNLHSASPSFSKDGCTHRVKSVLRLAKRPNTFTLRISAHKKLGIAVFSRFWRISRSKTALSVRQTSGL